MDKQVSQPRKRPRVLTLCMLAATVSTLALAGCGNGDEEMPPAQQPDTLEQDATTSTAPAAENEPAMADEPMNEDPGLGDDPAAAQEPMPDEQAPMPEENTSAASANDPEEKPGFGEGTDPMPGADEAGTGDAPSGDEEEDMTNGQ